MNKNLCLGNVNVSRANFRNFTKVIPLIDKFGLLTPQFNILFEAVLNNNLGMFMNKTNKKLDNLMLKSRP